jgi:hypothetical protein
MRFETLDKTYILLGVFVAALILANLLGGKIAVIAGITFSVGIFSYPITFLVTDIISEVHGKQTSKKFVIVGFIALLLTLILLLLSVFLPPASFWRLQKEYASVFLQTPRIIIASITAFIISQFHDVWAFHWWKNKTQGKYLWLRNNASTIVSQLIDTTIFIFIAFYLVTPEFTVIKMVHLIWPYWLLKVGVAIFDTPFVYLGVKWLKGKE